jgi:hypothetical protein
VNDIRPSGFVSIREFATICNLGEGHVRALLGDGKLASMKVGQRRWIPESEITARSAEELTSPWTQQAKLLQLQANAAIAEVELLSDEELVANAEAYLRGEYPRVDAQEEPTPTQELVASGD